MFQNVSCDSVSLVVITAFTSFAAVFLVLILTCTVWRNKLTFLNWYIMFSVQTQLASVEKKSRDKEAWVRRCAMFLNGCTGVGTAIGIGIGRISTVNLCQNSISESINQ